MVRLLSKYPIPIPLRILHYISVRREGEEHMKATLFSFNVYLRQDGKVELAQDMMVKPEEFQKEMDAGVPDYDGSHSIASMLRYF